MSRASPGYTGNNDVFSLDVLDQTARLEMVGKLKEFYPPQMPGTWDELTELKLAGCVGLLAPGDMAGPAERFCFYVYYSAAQEVADYKGGERAVVWLNLNSRKFLWGVWIKQISPVGISKLTMLSLVPRN